MWLWITAAWATPCAAPAHARDVLDALDRAERAYTDLDEGTFRGEVDGIRIVVPCLTDEVPRAIAARVHRFYGLDAFVAGDRDLAAREFAAARALEPAYVFPESFVPDGNPVWHTWSALDPAALPVARVPAPPAGRLQIDGRITQDRPLEWPVFVQHFQDDGAVLDTRYLTHRDPWPYAEAVPPAPASRAAWWGTTGALVVASGVSYGVAAGAHARWADDDTPVTSLAPLARRANRFGALSVTLLTVGVGTGAYAALGGAR